MRPLMRLDRGYMRENVPSYNLCVVISKLNSALNPLSRKGARNEFSLWCTHVSKGKKIVRLCMLLTLKPQNELLLVRASDEIATRSGFHAALGCRIVLPRKSRARLRSMLRFSRFPLIALEASAIPQFTTSWRLKAFKDAKGSGNPFIDLRTRQFSLPTHLACFSLQMSIINIRPNECHVSVPLHNKNIKTFIPP